MNSDNTKFVKFDHLQLAVRNILEKPLAFDWSVQGLGMMRVYLDSSKRTRLHITFIERTFKEDTEHARVMWRGSGSVGRCEAADRRRRLR